MIEAMAKAIPLVITSVPGPSDHVAHLQTAFSIPKADSNAIYGALLWVRQHPEEARQMATRGREYVLTRLDIRTVIQFIENAYISIAQNVKRNG